MTFPASLHDVFFSYRRFMPSNLAAERILFIENPWEVVEKFWSLFKLEYT